MEPEKILSQIEPIERQYAAELEQISHHIFTHPELGLAERESAAYLTDYLRQKGFRVQTGVCGMETAFIATFGTEGPQIDFPAEYDALPGYGEGGAPGHACGHNWIAATTCGAAVVMAELVRRGAVNAVVRLIGTPAEETYGGKVIMAREGVFDRTAAAIQAHLHPTTSTACRMLAMNSFEFAYSGRAAHAAAAPWDGVNALDAVQLLFTGVNALRQHLRPDVRIHGIVSEGGAAPNIVPERAAAKFFVRAEQRGYLNEVIERVKNIARGAALMTGAELSITEPDPPLDDLLAAPTLSRLGEAQLRAQGLEPDYTVDRPGALSGSSDIGNVSHVCPTLYMEIAPPDAPVHIHTAEALDIVDSPRAYEALHAVVRAMAGAAVTLLTDGKMLDAVREEFKARTARSEIRPSDE